MSKIRYILRQDVPENIPGYEKYQSKDSNLIDNFNINSIFDPSDHFIELHYYTHTNTLYSSEYDFRGYKLLLENSKPGENQLDSLTLDPIKDVTESPITAVGGKLLYLFLNDLFSKGKNRENSFFINKISNDRTELEILNTRLSKEEIVGFVNTIKSRLQDNSYFTEFRLNFGSNELFIGVNIDTYEVGGRQSIFIKLYEPLPVQYKIKDTFQIVELIGDPVVYSIEIQQEVDPIKYPKLGAPNFNTTEKDDQHSTTEFQTYDELLSYPVSSSYYEVFSLSEKKGITPNIDYSDFSNFVHFSLVEERLRNFYYKMSLLQTYETNLSTVKSYGSTSSTTQTYWEDLITGLVKNFDFYERHLYFESGSTSWPKSTRNKPHTNLPSSSLEVQTWYKDKIVSASLYDGNNSSNLLNTIPSYIREDESNEQYLVFVSMIGQHFDNIWIYSNQVTDKYSSDHRLTTGFPKELIGEVLKNFGVKIYNSNRSVAELFEYFTSNAYATGSEMVSSVVTVPTGSGQQSVQPVSLDSYEQNIYKRIYHNLPYLLKTKGTERGIRALINCYGIPSSMLQIRYYGGEDINRSFFFGEGASTASHDHKIRLNNTGSIANPYLEYFYSGSFIEFGATSSWTSSLLSTSSLSLLSPNTSVVNENPHYTHDTHRIQIGFSPTDLIDGFVREYLGGNEYVLDPYISFYFQEYLSASVQFDDYIGDPRDRHEPNYPLLKPFDKNFTESLFKLPLHTYLSLIKYVDNSLFRMIRDFVPARTVVDTGLIIKPYNLNRSKYPQPKLGVSLDTSSKDVEVGSIVGTQAGVYDKNTVEYDTDYSLDVRTTSGTVKYLVQDESPQFTGQLSGSYLKITRGELTSNNLLAKAEQGTVLYNIGYYSNVVDCTVDFEATMSYIPPTPTPTNSVTPTPTETPPSSPSVTASPSATVSITPTITPSNTVSNSVTPSNTVSNSVTPSNTVSITVTPTVTLSPSISKTPSKTPSVTRSTSVSPTVTPTISVTPTITPTISVTPTISTTPTPSPSVQVGNTNRTLRTASTFATAPTTVDYTISMEDSTIKCLHLSSNGGSNFTAKIDGSLGMVVGTKLFDFATGTVLRTDLTDKFLDIDVNADVITVESGIVTKITPLSSLQGCIGRVPVTPSVTPSKTPSPSFVPTPTPTPSITATPNQVGTIQVSLKRSGDVNGTNITWTDFSYSPEEVKCLYEASTLVYQQSLLRYDPTVGLTPGVVFFTSAGTPWPGSGRYVINDSNALSPTETYDVPMVIDVSNGAMTAIWNFSSLRACNGSVPVTPSPSPSA